MGLRHPSRRRSRRVLTLAEREDISRGIASGCSLRTIAQQVRRAPSTVSREVARHGGRAQYRAGQADSQAWESARRPKTVSAGSLTAQLQELVASKLVQDWSPKQISGWLKMEYPNDESLRVSHETIYRSLFLQARGALKEELCSICARSGGSAARAMPACTDTPKAGSSMPFRSGSGRRKSKIVPFPATGKAICCAALRNSHVATLVERHSRYCMLAKVSGKDTATVVAALSRHCSNYGGAPSLLT